MRGERRAATLLGVFALVIAACSPQASGTPSAPPGPTPTPTPTATPPAVKVDHRIGVRAVNAYYGEFFEKATGEKFVPRGSNYRRIAVSGSNVTDTLFGAGYSGQTIDSDLAAMRSLGYNAVRIFADGCDRDCIGNPSGGLSAVYLDNMADFLRRAKAHELVVLLASNDLPTQGGYVQKVEAQCCDPWDGSINTQLLNAVGLDTYRGYWHEIVGGLINRDAPLDTILAYEVRNELFVVQDKPPLSLTSGLVSAANGRSYDMADKKRAQDLVDDGVTFWIERMVQAIHQFDPGSLVAVGAFAPNAPNAFRTGDQRLVPDLKLIARSDVDFVDVHLYPGQDTLAHLMENVAAKDIVAKPLIMGEFGGFRNVFRTPQTAARALVEWQAASCASGLDGWFQWHWNGTGDPEVWTGSEADGAINQVLGPSVRPDQCATGQFKFLPADRAFRAKAKASRTLKNAPATAAVDGLLNTLWSAGASAPQWIEVTLSAPTRVGRVTLVTSQDRAGRSVHRILGGAASGRLRLLKEFRGTTRDGQVLEWVPSRPVDGMRVVRIQTLSGPSAVSWREIEVIASGR